MKVPAWMIFGLLISILIMDITKVMMVRSRIINTVEHSLDAALVGGVNLENEFNGRLYIDESKGTNYALTLLKSGLKLNDQLENNNLKDTTFQVSYIQDSERPKVSAEISTVITALSTKVVGLEGVPITIRKTQYHLGKFK